MRFLGAFFMQTLSKIILTQIKGAWTFEACVFHSETAFRDTYGKGAKLEAIILKKNVENTQNDRFFDLTYAL